MEKYLQMEWKKTKVFRDSLLVLPSSQEQLTASLSKTARGNFYNLHKIVSQIYLESDVELLDRKAVFCYD